MRRIENVTFFQTPKPIALSVCVCDVEVGLVIITQEEIKLCEFSSTR